jgi:hypothetical protein
VTRYRRQRSATLTSDKYVQRKDAIAELHILSRQQLRQNETEACTGMGMTGLPRGIRGDGLRYCGNPAGLELISCGSTAVVSSPRFQGVAINVQVQRSFKHEVELYCKIRMIIHRTTFCYFECVLLLLSHLLI